MVLPKVLSVLAAMLLLVVMLLAFAMFLDWMGVVGFPVFPHQKLQKFNKTLLILTEICF